MSGATKRLPPALIFGVPIDDLTLADTIAAIDDLIAIGRATGRTHQVATVNVDFLVGALHVPSLRTILQQCDLLLPDGQMVVWALRAAGMPVRERVAGADLVPELARHSADTGLRVHAFGSAPAVAEQAARLLAERYPGTRFTTDAGPMLPDVTEVASDVIESITTVDPDVLCVALGNPKQERFITAQRERIGSPVMIGIGGSLDMLVGVRKRAPRVIQRAGLEWVFRAAQEPRRLGRRYAHDIRVFGPRFVTEWRAIRGRRRGAGLRLVADGTDTISVTIGGNRVPSHDDWSAVADRLARGANLAIDPAGAITIRDAAAAQLVGLVRIARRHGGDVRWIAEPDRLVDALQAIGVAPALVGRPPGW